VCSHVETVCVAAEAGIYFHYLKINTVSMTSVVWALNIIAEFR
jgi:hypothetical protein